jgi:hypothetical protein
MDNEFVNLYITKMKAMVDDLIGQKLLADTKIGILETHISKLENQMQATQFALDQQLKEFETAISKVKKKEKVVLSEDNQF